MQLWAPQEKRVVLAGRIDPTPPPQTQLQLSNTQTHVMIAVKVGEALIPTLWTPAEAWHIADLIRERAQLVGRNPGATPCPIESPRTDPPDSSPLVVTRSTTEEAGTPKESDFTTQMCGDGCDCPNSESSLCANGA